MKRRASLRLVLVPALLTACVQDVSHQEDYVGVTEAALDACNEAVPANRYIDGIPAYAQCAATMNSAIYSNNGVDTSTTKVDNSWVRTQYSGGYQCTELAGRYLTFKWNVKWRPNGNAGQWCDTVPPETSGLVQTMTPVHGDLMVLAPGSCGAAASTGHVVVVDTVDTAKGRVVVVEQNGARRGTYMQSCGKCFLHVVANDGTNPGSPITPPSGMPAAGAPAGMAGAPSMIPVAGAAPPRAGAASPPPASTPPTPTNPPPAPTTPPAAGTAGSAGAAPSAPVIPPPAPSAPAPSANPGPTPPSSSTPAGDDGGGCSVRSGAGEGSGSQRLAAVLTLSLLGLWTRRRNPDRRQRFTPDRRRSSKRRARGGA